MPCSCSTASRSTTRRSSSCGSARACAATASSCAVATERAERAGRARGASLRFAPGRGAELAGALAAALRGEDGRCRGAGGRHDAETCASSPRCTARRRRGDRDPLRRAGARRRIAGALLGARRRARPGEHGRRRACSGCPAAANGRGLREAGRAAERRARARPADAAPAGRDARGDRRGAGQRRADRRSTCSRSTRCATFPTAALLGARARARATTVIAHAAFLTRRPARARDRHLPGRGRPPRRRARSRTPTGACSGCARRSPARARCAPGGAILAELAARLGARHRRRAAARWPSAALFEAVPIYGGLTLEELAGRGVRWPERARAATRAARDAPRRQPPRGAAPRGDGGCGGHLPLDLGRPRGRGLAGARVPAPAPARRALARRRRRARRSPTAMEMLVADEHGAEIRARVALRDAVPAGSVVPRSAACDARQRRTAARAASRSAGSRVDRGAGLRAEQEPAGERGDAVEEASSDVSFALVDYFEPWWIQIIKSIADLRRRRSGSCR